MNNDRTEQEPKRGPENLTLAQCSDCLDALMKVAFSKPRDPRSDEYKRGVRELLSHKLGGLRVLCPYKMGTVQADAFFSGVDEGHHIWRDEWPKIRQERVDG